MADAITNPWSVLEVLSSIDWKQWGSRGQLVAVLGRSPDGCALSQRDLTALTGRHHRNIRRTLDALVEERVLIFEAGSGRRPNVYALNLALHEWEGVPWVVDVAAVAYRVFHMEQLHPPYGEIRPVEGARHAPPLRRVGGVLMRAPPTTGVPKE